jgi:hypothetical protein
MSAAPARSTVRAAARATAAPSRTLGGARERALRLVAPARNRARRAPFVVVVVTVLSAGLVGLVVTNTALQDQAFRLAQLQQEATSLEVRQSQLQYEEDRMAEPSSLAEAAAALGMVPNASPVFLRPSTGEVVGVPTPAEPNSNVLGGRP